MRQWALSFAIVFGVCGSNLACTAQRGASVWGLNNSTNDYVIRLFDPPGSADPQAVDGWSFPAGAGGFTSTSHGLTVEVLDAQTCALVATRAATEDMLIDIDEHGAVSFIPERDRPAMSQELPQTTACMDPFPS